MSQDERVLNAVTKVSPKFNPRIPLNKIVVARLGSLLDEREEIVTVRFVRVAPATIDGGGLALISNRALLVVDAAPGQETRACRVPAETIRHASAVRLKDGYKVAVIAEDPKMVEMLTSSSRVADDLVGLIDDLAPGSADTNPRDLVENWWDDPTTVWPGSLGNKWAYLGGFSAEPESLDRLTLRLSRNGLSAAKFDGYGDITHRMEVAWSRVMSLNVEGSQQVQARTTFTRMLAVGIFAFAWKKRVHSGFLVLELDDGNEVIFASPLTEPELRGQLSSILSTASRIGELGNASASSAETPAPTDQPNAAERLRSLASLHADGLITDDEFQSKRHAIIDEL